MTEAILSLLPGGSLTAIGVAIVAVLGAAWRIFAAGKKSARNENRAKEANAYEQHLSDIERAVGARNDVLTGRVPPSPNDPNRRD